LWEHNMTVENHFCKTALVGWFVLMA